MFYSEYRKSKTFGPISVNRLRSHTSGTGALPGHTVKVADKHINFCYTTYHIKGNISGTAKLILLPINISDDADNLEWRTVHLMQADPVIHDNIKWQPAGPAEYTLYGQNE